MNTTSKIILIVANLFFWTIVLAIGFVFTWEFPPFSTEDGSFYPSMLWGNFFNAIVLYVHAFLLYPYRKKLSLPYWFCVLLLIFGTAISEAFIDYHLIFYLGLEDKFNTLFEDGDNAFMIYITSYFIRNAFIHLFWFGLSFIIVFVYESNRNQQIQKALKEEKLKAELKFLRAQINPHFLFNGINSVYFLIDEKPAIAKSTLLKFSDLLRYQLYECQDEYIPLAKELSHIQAYIDMEKIRKGTDIRVQLSVPETIESYMIAPLLFTPFLENAFKFVSNEDDGTQNKIDISIRQNEGQLFFEIENTTDKKSALRHPHYKRERGIGIENVKKRLNLIYPKKHHLDIFEKENRFIVRMNITLNNENA